MKSDPIKYENIFRTYLNFCPFFRRRLFHIKDLHDWFKKLEINLTFLDDFSNFFMFLDFLYRKGLVIPFLKINDPPRGFHIRLVGKERWKHRYDKNFISFIDSEESIERGLEYKEEVSDIIDNFMSFNFLNIYYYHPIQFIQIFSFIIHFRNKGEFFKYKDFVEYYYKRCTNPNPNYVNDNDKINTYLSELIKKKLKNVNYFEFKDGKHYPLLFNKFNRYKWLNPERLKICIKIEKILNLKLYSPNGIGPDIDFNNQASEYPVDLSPEQQEEWFVALNQNKKVLFDEREISTIQDFIKDLERKERNFEVLKSGVIFLA